MKRINIAVVVIGVAISAVVAGIVASHVGRGTRYAFGGEESDAMGFGVGFGLFVILVFLSVIAAMISGEATTGERFRELLTRRSRTDA